MSSPIKLSSRPTREFWELNILFEDEHLLVLDKPSGLLVSPDRYDPARPNLMKLLHEGVRRAAPWARDRGITYIANAHRLDFETSGVLLLAKSRAVLVALADQFGADKPVKVYAALVQGGPAAASFRVDAKLAPHPAKPGLFRVDARRGKKAFTAFEVRERFAGYTLVECRPTTGRTHQIRVHLRSARLPIVGDDLYGGHSLFLSSLKPNYRFKRDREERPLIGRVALHAESLTLRHPITTAELTVAAPWPKDLSVAVKYLRRYAPEPVVGGTPRAPTGPAELETEATDRAEDADLAPGAVDLGQGD